MAKKNDFLKQRAEARAKSENIQSSDTAPLGKNEDGTVTRSSNFIRQKAAERRNVIDQEYGADAYGGSGRYEASKPAGFTSWIQDVSSLSDRLSQEYAGRQGAYQAADAFDKYRRDNDASISILQNRASTYRNYFTDNASLYDENELQGIMQALDEYGKYLSGAQGDLGNEYDFWAQFQDQDAYDQYQKYLKWQAVPQASDFAEKSQYKTTYNPENEHFNAWTGTYTDTGFGDVYYDYINGDETAQSRTMLNDVNAGGPGSLYATTHDYWKDLPEDVVKTFNYIYATEGSEAAYEYIGATIQKTYTGIEALGLGFLQGTGTASLSAALGKAYAGISGDGEAGDRTDDWYNQLLQETAAASAEHPGMATAGQATGTLSLMAGIASGIGAIEGFSSLPAIAQSIISGGASLGGTQAIQGIGGAATGNQSWGDYALDVGTNTLSGAAGGALSSGIGTWGTKFLQGKGLAGNQLARTVVAGLSGTGFVAGSNAVSQPADYLRDPENYEFDMSQFAEEALVGFAFSAFGYLSRNYTTDPGTAAQMDADDALVNKYFKGMTQEEATAAYRQYAKQYHPDLYASADAATQQAMNATMAEVNAAYARFNVTHGAAAYQAAQEAKASGNTTAYEQAASEFQQSTAALQAAATQGGLATAETAEAAQILNAVASGMAGGMASEAVTGAVPAVTEQPAAPVVQETTTPAPTAQEITTQLVQAGVEPTEAESLGGSMAALMNGEEISGNKAGAIAENEVAVSILENTTGQKINTDAPLSEVKAAIRSLASPTETQAASPAGVDTALEKREAAEVETSMQPSAIDERTEQTAVEDFADTMEKAGAAAMRGMRVKGQSAADYVSEMMRFYNAGRSGSEFSPDAQRVTLNPEQAEAAFIAGQADAHTSLASGSKAVYTANKNTEVANNGAETGNQSGSYQQQRAYGLSADQPGSGIQSRAGSIEARRAAQGQRAASIRAAVEAQGIESVSTSSQGINGGTERKSLKIVPSSLYTQEMKQVSLLQRSQGRQVTFFTGELEVSDGTDSFAARGAISADGKKMWVNADDPQASLEEIAKHEEFHALIQDDPELLEDVRREILSSHSEQELRSMVEAYVEEYGFTDVGDSYILEEIFADAYAGIDIFDFFTDYEGATRFTGETRKAIDNKPVRGGNQIRGPTEQEGNNGQTTGIRTSGKTDGKNASGMAAGGRIAGDVGRGIGKGNPEVSERRIGYAERSKGEQDKLSEILISPIDNSPNWRSFVRGYSLHDITGKICDCIDSGNQIIAEWEKAVPGFREAVAQAKAYVGRTNAGRNISARSAALTAPTRDSKGRSLSDGQQRYFSQSTVRDENGNLLTLYHGSRYAAFDEFDLYEGAWLTPDREYAKVYAENIDDEANGLESEVYDNNRLRIYELYANIKNPLELGEVNAALTPEKVQELAGKIGAPAQELEQISEHYMQDNIYSLTRSHDFMELAAKYQFDGLTATEDGHRTFCAIGNPNQVKQTSNMTPSAKPSTRFSMKAPVEEKRDLIAVHNMTERNLSDSLKLGGLPMPSIAIVKADQGHVKYGTISLIFEKGTIDPQADSRNKVYGSDAYTPTAPQVDYPVDYDRLQDIERRISDLAKNVAGGIFAKSSVLRSMGIEDASSMDTQEIARRLSEQDVVKAAYLADRGKTLDPVMQDKEFDNFGNAALKSYVDQIGAQELARYAAEMEIGNGHEVYVQQKDAIQDIIREDYRRSHESYLAKKPELMQKRLDMFIENRASSPFRIQDFIRHAWEFYQDGGTTKDEIDRSGTQSALASRSNGADVAAWIEPQLDGLLGKPGIYNGKDPYKPSGETRSFNETHYSYTLENIVKAMKNAQSERGQSTFGVGAGSMQSVATPSYKNIGEIKADSGRLQTVDDEAYKQLEIKLDADIDSAIRQVRKSNRPHSDNEFEEQDIIGTVMMDAAGTSQTIDAIVKIYAKNGYKINNGTAKTIQDVFKKAAQFPTGYFEAKPQRAVGFGEVRAAIVPDTINADLRQKLADAGVQEILEYTAGDDADRMAKANTVESARFSRKAPRRDSDGKALTVAQQAYFEDSKLLDAGGNLLVLYHGTTSYGEITKFKKGSTGWLGPGIYLSSRKSDAQRYADNMGEGNGQLYTLYANITNPLTVTQGNPVPEILYAAYGRDSVYKARSAKQSNDTHIITPADIKKLQSKGYDGIAWKFGGSVEVSAFAPEQLKRINNQKPTGSPDVRFSLKPVRAIQPKNGGWERGATFDEVKDEHPTLFALDADEAETRNPTQISGTVKTYRKIYDELAAEGFTGTILDASSGLGYGTRAGREEYGFNVDDIEPFPAAKYKPMFTDYSVLHKTYDAIINNAVLNVMPQDLRDAMVVKMGQMLKPGGRAFINVRGDDVKKSSSKVPINESLMEYFISNTGSYQKGFTPNELASYLKDALGDGFRVQPSRKFGKVSAVVTKGGAATPDKYSRKATTFQSLQEENRELRKKLEELTGAAATADRMAAKAAYWQGQTKRTTEPALRQGDVDKLAKGIIKSYASTLEVKDISSDLKALGEFIMRGGDGKDELSWATVKDRAVFIAREIVENAEVLTNGEDAALYKEIKSLLRNKISISEADAHDIPDFGAWRKAHFGSIGIGINNGGLPVDVAYMELSDMAPWLFPAEQMAPSDQLLQMAEALDTMRPVYENPHDPYMAEAVEYCSNEIIDGMIDESVRQTPATFADRQAAKLDKAKGDIAAAKQATEDAIAAGKEAEKAAYLSGQMTQGAKMAREMRTAAERSEKRLAAAKQAVERVRANRDEQIAGLKEHYKSVAEAKRGRSADSKARTRLIKIARRLNNRKLPAVSKDLIRQYIGELDLVAKSMTGKTLDKITDLRAWYEEQRDNNPDFISDPSVEKMLQRLSKRQIGDMTAAEVEELTNVLLNIENEIRTQNKLINSADRRDTYAMGVQAINDINGSRGVGEGLWGGIDKLFINNTLSPVREIRRLTGYVDSDPLYTAMNELADGQRAMFDYERRTGELFQKWTEDKSFVKRIAGKHAEEIEIAGISANGPVRVKITPAMRMSLYLHSLNDQNLRHIAGGGITVPDIKLYKQGKLSAAYNRGVTVKLTPSEVRAITARMSDKDRAFALAANAYYNGMSRDAINATSEALKGYAAAQVENYFPIDTDKSFLKTDFDTVKFDGTIEGMGFLKERVNASGPIMLYDLNSVLKKSISQHAKYAGLAIPVRNFNKVWGVTKGSFNEDGSRNNFESSVQQAVKQKWGDAGYRYIEKLMTDLQKSGKDLGDWDKLMNRVRSNYAGAVLTLNASVAMKQAASYPTAGSVVGFKALARAMADFGKVDLDLIAKYTPLQWYRSLGFSTQELGDMAKHGVQLPAILNWVQGVDVLTTRKLWKASEYYVRQTRKGLKRGSDEYYRAVADVYNRVIEETQPNYTTMQRPQLLRSESTLLQNLAMFKTQPFQNFNILYDAIGNLDAKKRQYTNDGGAESKNAYQEAKKKAAWAVISQLMQLAVFAGMTAAWNLFRGKKDKYTDEKTGELTTQSVLKRIGRDMLGSQFSTVPFGSDVWELASSIFLKETYYGFDDVTASSIDDLANAFSKAVKALSAIWESTQSGEAIDWNEQRLQWDSVIDATSKVAGIPYENITNLFNAVYRQGALAANGQYKGTYAYLRLTTSPEKYSGDYYDNLYGAYVNDQEAYREIYADMIASGDFEADKIKSAMESRMKKDQGVQKAEELESRYLAPEQQKSYDRSAAQIERSDVWHSANAEQRDAVMDLLYGLASGSNDAASKSAREKITGGESVGISQEEYLLYKLALSMADQPTESGKLGSYTNDETEEAIRMLEDLTDAERDYLWAAQGKNETSTPNW